MAIEEELKSVLHTRVTKEQKDQLRAIARLEQTDLSDVIRKALRQYLAGHFPRYYGQDRPEPGPGPQPPPPPQHEPQPELAGV
jgi:hypothetical protein